MSCSIAAWMIMILVKPMGIDVNGCCDYRRLFSSVCFIRSLANRQVLSNLSNSTVESNNLGFEAQRKEGLVYSGSYALDDVPGVK